MDERKRIEELTALLNAASEAYYNGRDEIMSNAEWDAAFDELAALEQRTGYAMPDSPTASVGADEDLGGGRKEPHEYPALSLAKSKEVSVLQRWAGSRPVWLSWKLDGITLVATYDRGRLSKLMTRGNGSVGTNITYMAPYILGLPQTLRYEGHLVVRGEALISYTDFERLNEESADRSYANPRNLVAGTLALDPERVKEVGERAVSFHPFTLVHLDEPLVSWGARMQLLTELGFTVVESRLTDSAHLQQTIDEFSAVVREGGMDYPVDGLVVTFEDTDYAATGSVTGHHATNAGMAFKWQDTAAETVLDHIEWGCASSVITPVAVFDMVELEGTEVRRASLCNISEMKRLGIGADRQTALTVIKANMIIPKVIRAEGHGTAFEIPASCPVCGAPTEVKISALSETETLVCTNPRCSAKHLQKFARFVSKECMDIDGLSEKTIMKLINEHVLTDFASLYDIAEHRETIVALEGFGEKSYENLIAEVERSRTVDAIRFVNALCIPQIGPDAAKKIIRFCGTAEFFARLKAGQGFEDVDGIGPERSAAVTAWYAENAELAERLLQRITVEEAAPQRTAEGLCKGLTFVITGDVHHFANRSEFKAYVESAGGKVAGSVSGKTDFLVNNDVTSTSGKNKKAAELGVPVISEEEFMARFMQQ